MSNQERLEALTKRLTQDMMEAVHTAIKGGRLPASLTGALPITSVDALKNGESLESVAAKGMTSLDGLEAIVALVGRPPLLIRNDAVILESLPDLPPETSTLIKGVQKWVRSVGRIEFRNHSMAWGGSGWVIERREKGALIVTNRHVAQIVARRKADGSSVFMRAPSGARYGAAIDFGEEVESKAGDNSRTAELVRIEYLADDTSADVALLFIEAADFELPSAFELLDDCGKVVKDDLVALVGYPAYDPRNDADAQARYFRDLYEVKRFAPGKILQTPEGGLLTYDCTSLGGNSGSPVISLTDGKVIGLHFSGVYGKENTAVGWRTLNALVKGERPVSVALQSGHAEAKDGIHPAEYFVGREGFNKKFLKAEGSATVIETPWPTLPTSLDAELAEPSDSPPEKGELRYTHFGVKYSAKHKLPLITAVNIDGEASVRIKRGDDKWFSDGRIPLDVQLGSVNFADGEIDRGHMVRREDPNWGEDGEAQQANDDTFHYVNACAQHSRLNQAKQLWQGLENYILDSARTHGFEACVFSGPILRPSDSDEEEIELDGAIAPLEFWKVVATLDEGGKALHATAYILSQGQLIRQLLEKRSRREAFEGIVLGEYRTFQVAVSDLADATGYNFGPYVEADPLRKSVFGEEAIKKGEPVFLPIFDVADVVL